MTSYKINKNLSESKQIITKFIDDVFLKDTENSILSNLNGRLFISYYNIKKHRQQTVSKFKDKNRRTNQRFVA